MAALLTRVEWTRTWARTGTQRSTLSAKVRWPSGWMLGEGQNTLQSQIGFLSLPYRFRKNLDASLLLQTKTGSSSNSSSSRSVRKGGLTCHCVSEKKSVRIERAIMIGVPALIVLIILIIVIIGCCCHCHKKRKLAAQRRAWVIVCTWQ